MLKRFNFFVASDVNLVRDDGSPVSLTISCTSDGSHFLVFGSEEGKLVVVNRELVVTHEELARQPVMKLCQKDNGLVALRGGPITESELVFYSMSNDGVLSVGRILHVGSLLKNMKTSKPYWAANSPDATALDIPNCVCMAASDKLEQVALGFSDGHVLVIRHDEALNMVNARNGDISISTLQNFKQIGNTSVTGLGFMRQDDRMWLWVATDSNLRSYITDIKSKRQIRSTFGGKAKLIDIESGPELDNEGCALGCCCVASDRSQFVLAKNDRVEFFGWEDPASVYAVSSGKKAAVKWMHNYLVVVSQEEHDVVQIYDFKNKFIAQSHTLKTETFGRVNFLATQWNRLFIVSTTNNIMGMKEKDNQTKLNDLFKRNLYGTALSLASSSGCDAAQIAEIHKMYGDHLYGKGSFDEAMTQYTKILGYVEPSYVIRRFLDSQRIDNLTQFLEVLHNHPSITATGEHTTLLLNCYTKQKSESRLEEFVAKCKGESSIDVEAAVTVLKSARYYYQALTLAKYHSKHGLYLEMTVEDLEQYDEGLEYLYTLSGTFAAEYVQRYVKLLLNKRSEKTNELLISICCDVEKWQTMGKPEEFIHLFVDHPKYLVEFLRSIVNYKNGLIATPLLWNTYLELMVGFAKSDPSASAEVMSILRNPEACYDANQVLVLVQSSGFIKGQLFLYERLQMYHMLIRHYMEQGDNVSVLAKCRMYGSKDSNLWVQVLMYLAEQKTDVEQEVQEVLHHIDRNQILPALLVIEMLAKNPVLSLSTIRPYILGQLGSSQKMIDDHNNAISHLKIDTDKMKSEIKELRSRPKVFTSTKCNLTGGPLELPTVHFLSGNSYNLSSLPGGGAAADAAAAATANTKGVAPHSKLLEDPKCAAEQHSVSDIMEKLEQNAKNVDEEFFNQLEISHDGFGTVAEYFSKCLFENQIEPSSRQGNIQTTTTKTTDQLLKKGNIQTTTTKTTEHVSKKIVKEKNPFGDEAKQAIKPKSTNPFI